MAESRTYFRVRIEDGAVFDLAYDPDGAAWTMLRQLSGPAGETVTGGHASP